LDQLGPGHQPAAVHFTRLAAAKSATFSRPVVFVYGTTHRALVERAQRVWDALADGRLKRPMIERHWLAAASHAYTRLETVGRWCW
jgi:NADPH:quinone reductase